MFKFRKYFFIKDRKVIFVRGEHDILKKYIIT